MMSNTLTLNANQTPLMTAAHGTTVRNLLVLALFALTVHVPVFSRADDAAATPAKVSAQDLPRFHQVHPYFWRGAAPSFAGLDQLKQLGVKTVVDLRRSQDRIEEERKYCSLIGLNYVSLPLGDFVPAPDKQAAFMNIVGDAAAHPEHGPVFLHCSHGSDRTGFLTAMWRVQHDHWSILEATSEMLQYGFFVHKFQPRN